MRTSMLIAVAALASIAAAAAEAPARPWTDAAEVGVILTSGNSQSTNFAAANKYAYTWENAEFVSNAAALRAESRPKPKNTDGVVTEPAKETTAESYLLDGKYRRTVRDGFFWYALASWNRNRFQGIDSRLSGGGGVGYRLFERERSKLAGEVGFDYTKEDPLEGDSRNFAGARAFVGYERKIGGSSKFGQEVEVLENLKDTEDLRAKSVSALTASLTSKLALKLSYTILYDKQPAEETLPDENPTNGDTPIPREFDKVDTILTATLVVNF